MRAAKVLGLGELVRGLHRIRGYMGRLRVKGSGLRAQDAEGRQFASPRPWAPEATPIAGILLSFSFLANCRLWL